jgi:hypothetical protein
MIEQGVLEVKLHHWMSQITIWLSTMRDGTSRRIALRRSTIAMTSAMS